MIWKKLREIFLFEINKYNIGCIAAGYVLNILGFYLGQLLKLPIWADTIGSMFVAIQLGPIAGMFIGGASALTTNLISGSYLLYTFIGILNGFLIGLFFPRKNPDDHLIIISVAILSAILSSFLSIPLNLLFYNGMPGNIWGDALYEMAFHTVSSKLLITIASELFVDIPDRVISILIAVFLVKHSRKLFKKKKLGAGNAAVISVCIICGIILGQGMVISATDISDTSSENNFNYNYEMEIYDGSSQINCVLQSLDGYIWVGTYSGLYQFDGQNFNETLLDNQIRNVMTLYEDSHERLWIGTNDSGAYCYDPSQNIVKCYNSEEGMLSDSIRTICEDDMGNIYIGTSSALSMVTPTGELITYSDMEDIYYTRDLTNVKNGCVAGITNSGLFYIIRNGQIILSKTCDEEGSLYRRLGYNNGELAVGDSSGNLHFFSFDGKSLKKKDSMELGNLSYVNYILYSKDYDGYFLCCQNGMAFIDYNTRKLTELEHGDIKGEISYVYVDMQDNIWFTSSKEGLIKFSETPFANITKGANLKKDVVNAVCIAGDDMFIGTDNGLAVLNAKTRSTIYKEYTSKFEDMRIRHIMQDSKGNIWISTYGSYPLVRTDDSEEIRVFDEENDGLIGDRIRFTMELSDGSILVSGNNGLSFIEDDKVVATLGQSDGLSNSYILSAYEKEDGTILAGSDGDGIYLIKDRKVVGHIGKEEGLNTAVIMRIVKCRDGFLYVASNSIYYDDGNSIKMLDAFYSNNYDVIVIEDKCFITSSAGLFVMGVDELLRNDYSNEYTLFNKNWGLMSSLNANSWNALYDGKLYLCCTDGVRCLDVNSYSKINDEFNVQLNYIETLDDYNIIRGYHDRFEIPAIDGRIDFHIAVNNYSLSNPIVTYYLEGRASEGVYCYQDEMVPLSYAYLPGGDYVLRIEVVDSNTLLPITSKRVKIVKAKMMYEKLYFQLYMFMVFGFMLFYIAWLFYTINNRSKRIVGLQKEMTTDPMTGILNKAGAHKTLETVCKENMGILLMIDLDSFKLVNDIYGHDMGDKILIRFAELIKMSIHEDDICGRLGGDEFVAFIKNVMDEEDVNRLTRTLNREIMKSAKEYMGDDMSIPLGTSIGAVRVPFEGTEMEELLKLADKALYVVKQNGKHGYSFYQKKGKTKDLDHQKNDKNSLKDIKKIIGERNEGRGAYEVNFEKLQTVYKFLNRNDKRHGYRSCFARITIEQPDGEEVKDEIKEDFEDVLVRSINKNDVVSLYSGDLFVLFAGEEPEAESLEIAKRKLETAISKWKSRAEVEDYLVNYEIELVGE